LCGWGTDCVQPVRPIIDKTGLTGRYDYKLEWADDTTPGADPGMPSVFTAFQEQPGLKLQSAKAPVQVLIVDHVEKPSGN
jgi:uncharacterized protein (TIGR03435 family)